MCWTNSNTDTHQCTHRYIVLTIGMEAGDPGLELRYREGDSVIGEVTVQLVDVEIVPQGF